MSYAPQRLLELRDYLRQKTGLPLVSLGIVGDSAHTYGYHLGKDRLRSSDYSRSAARDKAGLSNAASASDTGNFRRLVQLTMWAVAEARAGRRPDSREIIGPWSDGRAYRFDALSGWKAEQRARGDSHEGHMHESWFRDSEHRDKIRYYRPFFEGSTGGSDAGVPVPSGNPLLRNGSTGTDVRQLQGALNQAIHAGLATDGQYGPATETAVKAFQRAAGLTADGIYGPGTAGALRQALEDDMGVEFSDRVDMYDEAGKKRWWAGSVIGKDSISVHQAFMYAAMTPFYVRSEVLPLLAAAKKRDEALLAAVKGVDTQTILARIDQRAAEDAARDRAMVQLLEQHSSGRIDAEAVVRKFGELLTAAAGDDES